MGRRRPLGPVLAGCLFVVLAASELRAGKVDAAAPAGLLVGSFGAAMKPYEIRAIDLQSGKQSVLRKGERAGDPFHVLLSPDGARVAFSYGLHAVSTATELRIMQRDGTGERTLVANFIGEPVWSPDGALILVPGVGAKINAYIIDPQGNRYWALNPCKDPHRPWPIRWSADGKAVFAWSTERDHSSGLDPLLRCELVGKVSRVGQVDAGPDVALAPDEKQTLTSARGRSLMVSDLSGTAPRAVLSDDDLDDRQMFWSPDSKWIGGFAVLVKTKRTVPRKIVLVNVATGAQRVVKGFSSRGLQWWAPQPPSTVDARAIVHAALGEGRPFTTSLHLAGMPEQKPEDEQ